MPKPGQPYNVPTLNNPKSRGNYAPGAGMTDEQWERIFGKRQEKLDSGDVELANCPKDRPARGDYAFCRKMDNFYLEYRRFKNEKRQRKS